MYIYIYTYVPTQIECASIFAVFSFMAKRSLDTYVGISYTRHVMPSGVLLPLSNVSLII